MKRYSNHTQIYHRGNVRNCKGLCFAKWGMSTAGQFGNSRLFTGSAEKLLLGCVVKLFRFTYGGEIWSQRLTQLSFVWFLCVVPGNRGTEICALEHPVYGTCVSPVLQSFIYLLSSWTQKGNEVCNVWTFPQVKRKGGDLPVLLFDDPVLSPVGKNCMEEEIICSCQHWTQREALEDSGPDKSHSSQNALAATSGRAKHSDFVSHLEVRNKTIWRKFPGWLSASDPLKPEPLNDSIKLAHFRASQMLEKVWRVEILYELWSLGTFLVLLPAVLSSPSSCRAAEGVEGSVTPLETWLPKATVNP